MKDDDNWLINVQIYSREFRADLNSIWMDEMELACYAYYPKSGEALSEVLPCKGSPRYG